MIWSLNEVQTTATKAARGAGLAIGQAEDLGAVAAYLAGTWGDVRPVTMALQEPLLSPVVQWTPDSVDISEGCAALTAPVIRDGFLMGLDRARMVDVSQGPFVAAMLALEGVPLTWQARDIRRSDTEVLKPRIGPVQMPDADRLIWVDLAARTYVPETAQSRTAGAGAGLTDND